MKQFPQFEPVEVPLLRTYASHLADFSLLSPVASVGVGGWRVYRVVSE